MSNRIVRSLVGAFAVAASLALAPTAQGAVYYQSDFDPIDFTLRAIFKFDESCLDGPAGWVAANGSNPCAVSMISAVATVKDWNSAHTTLLGTAYITFVDISSPSGVSSIISGIYDNNNAPYSGSQPAGIQWTPLNFTGPELIALTDTIPYPPGDPNLVGTWGLNIFNFNKPINNGPPFDSTAFLLKKVCFIRCAFVPFDSAVVVSDFTTDPTGLIPLGNVRPLGVTQDGTPIFVPKPSSIALLLGALGAGWLTRRRKIAA